MNLDDHSSLFSVFLKQCISFLRCLAGISSHPQIFPTATTDSDWSRMIKTDDDTIYSPQFVIQQQFLDSTYGFSNERKQITYFQDEETAPGSKATNQTWANQLNTRTAFPYGFIDGLAQVCDSNCVLSLLSSPTRTSNISLSHMVPPAERLAQPLALSLQNNGFVPTEFSCADTALVSDQANGSNCCSIFRVGEEGSSESACVTLPFAWP